MLDEEPRTARPPAVYLAGGVACAGMLLVAGFLPAYRADVRVGKYVANVRSPETFFAGESQSLLDDARWPYVAALVLALAGFALGGLLRSGGRSVAAACLVVAAMLPASALFTDYLDPDEFGAPFSGAAAEAERAAEAADGRAGASASVEWELLAGTWLTALLIMGSALGAAIWLGRRVQALSSVRAALGLAAVLIVLGIAGISWAEGATDSCGIGVPADTSDVESGWATWLSVYLCALPAAIGLGALTRRRWFGGATLVLCGVGAIPALFVIGFLLIAPCIA